MLVLAPVSSRKLLFPIIVFILALLLGAGDTFAQRSRGKDSNLNISKGRTNLPKAKILKQKSVKARNMKLVKPPSSKDLLQGGTLEVEYERLLDEEISKYFKLSKTYRRSRSRGEIWLRLAERYVEKARIIEFREQERFEKALTAFEQGKTKRRPRLRLKEAKNFHLRAIRLYEWFVRDFPKDPKVDQALFFLGYNHFEVGNNSKGEAYYKRLVRDFPRSAYVSESNFALGEFYFENDKWKPALEQYNRVIKRKRARLYTFALYKASWCLYRLGRTKTALKTLEKVIRVSRKSVDQEALAGTRAVNKIRLASEALKDYVPFYSEAKKDNELYKRAEIDFRRVARKPTLVDKMLERLAYIYADGGNRVGARYLFKRLIDKNPLGSGSADYQYQIVLAYSNSTKGTVYKNELFTWITKFGPESVWAKENAKNTDVIQESFKLQESTLRNQTLQLHQTAQNSRAQFSQKLARESYELYLKYFGKSEFYAQMRFFYSELLFDMKAYDKAAEEYQWYITNFPKGQFYETSVINRVLALEKKLPTAASIEKKRKALGKKTEKFDIDANSLKFIAAAKFYREKFPKGDKVAEVTRRVGVIYYAYNHFDEALEAFAYIVKRYPRQKDALIAAELTLDIFKLKEDLEGFQKSANDLLAVPAIAKSKIGRDIRANLERAALEIADKQSKSKDFQKSAQNFESFFRKNPKSPRAIPAIYNSAINYEKAGDLLNAIRMYALMTKVKSKNKAVLKLKQDSRENLANLYRSSGQLSKAAVEYERIAAANPSKAKQETALLNAALVYDSLNDYGNAFRVYNKYKGVVSKNKAKDVTYAFAEMELRRNRLAQASRYYEAYVKLLPSDGLKLMRSVFMVADISSRTGKASKGKLWYEKTVGTYRSLKRAGRPAGVRYAAESSFILALRTLSEMKKVRLGRSDKSIQQAFLKLEGQAAQLSKKMKTVVAYNYGPYIVAALTSSAQAQEVIAGKWAKAPVPKGYNDKEQIAQFKELYSTKVKEFQGNASKLYKTAFERSLELEAFGPWTDIARRGVARYNNDQKYKLDEIVYDPSDIGMEGI